MRGIVVGVDGSEQSHRALAWAVDQAEQRGAQITAVHAYRAPRHNGTGSPYAELRGPYLPAETVVRVAERQRVWFDQAQELARSRANAIVAQAIMAMGDHEGVVIERYVLERDAAKALVELSDGADMLVVGHRGRGGFRGLRLGSVALTCAHHARCPVVVVR